MKHEPNWNTNGNTHPIPRLYVLVGCPGSGKSTWAKKHFVDTYYVSRDEIRFNLLAPGDDYFSHEKEVYNKFIDGIKLGLSFGDTIADATHLNRSSRNKLFRSLQEKIDFKFDVYFIVMDTPLAICLERNAKREGRAKVPEDTLIDMYGKMSIPTKGEGYNVKGVWLVRE